MRVAVTAGYSQSLHAIALIHRLVQRGHTVPLVLQVRMLDRKRLRGYLRQLGWRTVWAKAQARLWGVGGGGGFERELAPMQRYLRENGIGSSRVREALRVVGGEHRLVSSLNDRGSQEALREHAPDLVIYAGGGIMGREFLETARLGVINAHGGPLPQFRGMNAVEWPLLHGVKPAVTVYRLNAGIDTGDIHLRRHIPVADDASVLSLRGEAARTAIEALLDAVDDLAAGRTMPQPQSPEMGRSYFVMAAPLVEVLDRWLSAGAKPQVDASSFVFPTLGTGNTHR